MENFETKLKRIEEIVEKLERGGIEIEASLKIFEEGVKIARECQSYLKDAEQKVTLLMDGKENTN